jgi:hypothetical protein
VAIRVQQRLIEQAKERVKLSDALARGQRFHVWRVAPDEAEIDARRKAQKRKKIL